MAKKNTEPENSQSHKKTPRIHKKITCDVCGAKISSAHKSKHKKTKTCQEAGKLIDNKILLRIEKNEKKRKSYADHVNAKDDLLKMINLIEEKIIIKKKPSMAAGMIDIKSMFMSSIIMPIKMKDRKNKPISFFLYGPSGNGKSMIVRNLCAEPEITLFEVTMKGLMRYHAEELALCDLIFQMAAYYSPAVIFFDKADQIFNVEATTTTAERATTYLKLIEENSSSENPSFIIAATTKPQETCREFLTNFSRVIHVGIPSKADRIEILKSKFPPEKLAADVDFAVLASKTQKFSAHDLEFLCIDAYHLSLENYTRSNIEAISSVGFSLTNNMVKEIEELRFHKITMQDFNECLAKRVPNSSDIVNEFLEKWSPDGKEPNDADFHPHDCQCFSCIRKRQEESTAFEGAFKGRGVLIGGVMKEKGKMSEKDE